MSGLHEQFESLAAGIPALERQCDRPVEGVLETRGFVANLWRSARDCAAVSRCADLDALCKKIALGKCLYEHYTVDWKKTAEACPLDADEVAAVTAVLLRCAAPIGPDENVLRGPALKYLNAAFTLITDLEQSDNPHAETSRLRRIAQHILLERTRDHAASDSVVP